MVLLPCLCTLQCLGQLSLKSPPRELSLVLLFMGISGSPGVFLGKIPGGSSHG